jgi:chitosanase
MNTKSLIKKILLAFEQSSTSIKYDKIYLWNDGPDKIKQITVSFGVTEYGNLKGLIKNYCDKQGKYSEKFNPYLDKIGKTSLANNQEFINLLKESASDPLMQIVQEQAFDNLYIDPAYNFALQNGFQENLSKLVICDSYLHSGSILQFLRNKFATKVPSKGGDERKWIYEYCNVRKDWLKKHSNKILNNTVYRMDFMLDRLSKGDWQLCNPPYNVNGVIVKD